MQKYLCVHGHFYQPPRENPWLEAIEQQDSAAPFHDWNERVTAECYRPNTRARRLDDQGRLVTTVNNYAQMSFNFGPTLLSWLEEHEPEVYAAILDADRESIARFGGHGSAMAQAYNHMIMPLANDRDRRTQVLWGIADFRKRFGRDPEGMWLPETAVDTAALESLAEHGIKFTVLAPRQCKRVRMRNQQEWKDVGESVDPSRAYYVNLPSGRRITVFFYDGPVSQAVAFERLLASGERFASRLLSALSAERSHPQLVHIATDGETYGHHHRFGDMALAYALETIERSGQARLTNYAEFLELHPPVMEAEIVERSSWSCNHGVERWRADCGCSTGGHPGWNQAWRGPLREALDSLRDELAPLYEREAGRLLRDPWGARDAYIEVVLDRSPGTVDRFLRDHARTPLDQGQRVRALKLLELQRNAMLMYTSCGWFFDELSGIETVQLLCYAGRVIQLAREVLDVSPMDGFLERLARARSNVAALGDGRDVFDRLVRPAFVSLLAVGAHYAVDSLYVDQRETSEVYCYDAERLELSGTDSGHASLRVGRVRLTSRITRESGVFSFAAIHMGDHIVHAGVREFLDEARFADAVEAVGRPFERGEVAEIIRAMDRQFRQSTFSLRSLFRDEQRKVIARVLHPQVERVNETIEQLYERNAPLMRFLGTLDVRMPEPLALAARLVLSDRLLERIEASPVEPAALREVLDEAERVGVALDVAGVKRPLESRLGEIGRELGADGNRLEHLRHVLQLLPVIESMPVTIDLSELQLAACELRDRVYPTLEEEARSSAEFAARWVADFERLAAALRVRLD